MTPDPALSAGSAQGPSLYARVARQFFRVILGDLHHTAELIGDEAALEALRARARALHVDDGMFGAQPELADAAAGFVDAWYEGAARIADDVQGLADDVHRAAADYESCDAEAAAAFGRLPHDELPGGRTPPGRGTRSSRDG